MKTNELAPSSYLTDCVVQFSPSAKIDKSVLLKNLLIDRDNYFHCSFRY